MYILYDKYHNFQFVYYIMIMYVISLLIVLCGFISYFNYTTNILKRQLKEIYFILILEYLNEIYFKE